MTDQRIEERSRKPLFTFSMYVRGTRLDEGWHRFSGAGATCEGAVRDFARRVAKWGYPLSEDQIVAAVMGTMVNG